MHAALSFALVLTLAVASLAGCAEITVESWDGNKLVLRRTGSTTIPYRYADKFCQKHGWYTSSIRSIAGDQYTFTCEKLPPPHMPRLEP